MTKKIIWIDCETSGLSPRDNDITELSGIIDINGEAVEEFTFLMHPAFKERVSLQALKVQGRTLDEVMAHPYGQREAKQEMERIMERYVKKYEPEDKFIWGGQNPQFDMGFVQQLWLNQGDKYFGSWFDYHAIDTIAVMAAVQLRGYFPALPNFKLQSICNAVGVPLENAHKAINDIRATRAAFYKLAALIPEPVV